MTSDVVAVREANYRFLLAALEVLYARVEAARRGEDPRAGTADAEAAMEAARAGAGGATALDLLVEAFSLDAFETDVVLLCVGFEIDPRFSAQNDVLTTGSALATLPDGHWSAFAPEHHLVRWGILEVEPNSFLLAAPLRLSRDVLSFLLGFGLSRPRGDAFTRVAPPVPAPASHEAAAEPIARAIETLVERGDGMPAVELHGADAEERRAVAALVAASLGIVVDAVDARDLPPPGPEMVDVLLVCARRALLADTCLLLEVGEDAEQLDRDRVRRALDLLPELVIVSGPAGCVAHPMRPVVRHEVVWPGVDERLEVWSDALAEAVGTLDPPPAEDLDSELAELAYQYRLGGRAIRTICAEAVAALDRGPSSRPGPPAPRAAAASGSPLELALRAACRRRIRGALDPFADRIDVDQAPRLVLPDREQAQLDELELRIRHAHTVQQRWGITTSPGGGVAALFAGPSGTGKTLAATWLARSVGFDLYRADLSLIVSKYIGETEKNLRQLFDAADFGGIILLFDEADALFGKRTETKDSHDRYANLEVAYLLQKMEQTRAPCVLTTNLRDAIDSAFQRRLHFVIDFPFPDEPARLRIWAEVFPPEAPVRDLDHAKLARLPVNGAAIRGIAVRAAFLAARTHEPIQMHHLLEGARREYRKTGRDINAQQVADWA